MCRWKHRQLHDNSLLPHAVQTWLPYTLILTQICGHTSEQLITSSDLCNLTTVLFNYVHKHHFRKTKFAMMSLVIGRSVGIHEDIAEGPLLYCASVRLARVSAVQLTIAEPSDYIQYIWECH